MEISQNLTYQIEPQAGGLTGKEEGVVTSQAWEANLPLYFAKFDFSGAKDVSGTVTSPRLLFQLFPQLVPKCKVAEDFVVSGMEALYSPKFCSLLQIDWTCVNWQILCLLWGGKDQTPQLWRYWRSAQVCVTLQCKAHREIKHGQLGNISSVPSSILFSNSNQLMWHLCSSRNNSNKETISVNNSAFSILYSCWRLKSTKQMRNEKQDCSDWYQVWHTTSTEKTKMCGDQISMSSPNAHFQAGHSVLILKWCGPTVFPWILLSSRIVELDT